MLMSVASYFLSLSLRHLDLAFAKNHSLDLRLRVPLDISLISNFRKNFMDLSLNDATALALLMPD